MRRPILVPIVLIIAGCSNPSGDVQPLGPADIGVASVAGEVSRPPGTPVARNAVTIACANAATPTTVSTDSNNRYVANLSLTVSELGSRSARIRCLLTAIGPYGAPITLDTLIGFGPPGLPHVLQIIDLRESP